MGDKMGPHASYYLALICMQVYIGTSGWNYNHWRMIFYPEDCPRSRWLEFYARSFNTVELNATFYRSMREKTFENWYKRTPAGFLWSVKANRFITHIKRLKEAEEPLARFLRSLAPLKEKQGPILIQLPPSLGFEGEVFDAFSCLLPGGLKFALEARNKSWLTDASLSALEKYHIAWCISDTAQRYPYLEAITADFIYIRLHGSKMLYASDYSEEELKAWAEKIRSWGRETYVYFDNDYMAYAPQNALRLEQLLGEALS